MDEAEIALEAWHHLGQLKVERIPIGLINHSYRVHGAAGQFVLQRLHPIFAPMVNQDIDALTRYLHTHRFPTPLMVETSEGELWTMADSACWRIQTFVEGATFDEIQNIEMATSSGSLVGRFHRTLAHFDHVYQFVRSNVHDTKSYLTRLEKAVGEYQKHEWYDKVARQADHIFRAARRLPDLTGLPKRHSHGDLKVSNLLYNEQSEATCLIDLDTIGKMPWPIEMGDAFRSWCNPSGENATSVQFSELIFDTAVKSYAAECKHLWTSEEKDGLWHGIELIPLELSTRFLLDVLEDIYFGWDETRFKSRAEHNWVRSTGQWSLYLDIERQSKSINAIIREAFRK